MCRGFEAGSYLRPQDRVSHSTLGLKVIKERKEADTGAKRPGESRKISVSPPAPAREKSGDESFMLRALKDSGYEP